MVQQIRGFGVDSRAYSTTFATTYINMSSEDEAVVENENAPRKRSKDVTEWKRYKAKERWHSGVGK